MDAADNPMRLEAAIGQLLCPTLFGAQLRDRPYDRDAVHAELERYGWGGYILFHGDRDATARRVADLQASSRIPLLVAADMEHGAGQQIRGLTAFPTAMAFGAADDLQAVYDLGAWTAAEALSVGVNWILAPVADVTSNPLNPIISIRSFGGDAARVSACVEAFVKGCQDQGALACAKHFPGHGDTETDSHSRLGVVNADRARLETVELPPFRAAIRADVAAIMSAHLAVPALGADSLPATLSHAVMTGVLRRELGYSGLVVTDALVMGGITRHQDPVEAAVGALLAGCDMLLMPPDPVATYQAILRALESGRLPETRVREAAGRVLAAKRRLTGPRKPLPARPAEELAAHVARQALTLAKGKAETLRPDRTLALAVNDGVEPERLEAWHAALGRHGLSGRVVGHATPEDGWREVLDALDGADAVLMGVFSPIRVSKDRSLLPASLVEPLQAICRRRPTTLVSFSSPFLVAQFPEAEAWVLAYGSREVQIEAVMAALLQGVSGSPASGSAVSGSEALGLSEVLGSPVSGKLISGSRLPGRLPVTLPASVPAPRDEAPPPSGGPSFA